MTAAEAFTLVLHAARDLRIRGALTPGKQNMAREAAVVLNTPQSTRVRQGYRVFLCDLFERCVPHGVLLCAIQLETNTGPFGLNTNIDLTPLPHQGHREGINSSAESWDNQGDYGLCSLNLNASSTYGRLLPPPSFVAVC
ncbi:hypothetical protein DHEL01_v211960 [Diaporthe helianthi]|uniref:Uncharacterized protein n=1 Tax=Diaporthe helianthi TaxID=158607 RepID=A0A2P5HHB2_DIAHE|nr:hypothetical protein DHEL01_v211960 [Diaporthe helianthi]